MQARQVLNSEYREAVRDGAIEGLVVGALWLAGLAVLALLWLGMGAH